MRHLQCNKAESLKVWATAPPVSTGPGRHSSTVHPSLGRRQAATLAATSTAMAPAPAPAPLYLTCYNDQDKFTTYILYWGRGGSPLQVPSHPCRACTDPTRSAS